MKKVTIGNLEISDYSVRQCLFLNCECTSIGHLIRIIIEKYKDEKEVSVYFESNLKTYLNKEYSKNKFFAFFQNLINRFKNAFNIIIGRNCFLTFDFVLFDDSCLEFSEALKNSVELVKNTDFKK